MTTAALPMAHVRTASALERRRLGGCLLVVTLVHVALLLAPVQPPGVAQVGSTFARSVQLRIVPIAAEAARMGADRSTLDAAHTSPARHRAGVTGAQALAHAPARPGVEPEPAREATAAPGPIALGSDPYGDYLPRSALTVGPRPVVPVLIDYPAFDGERDLYAGEFDVLIDDSGGVVRVLPVTVDLPMVLSDAVRDAFLPARFDPGEIEGRPVRSRLRIEVTFDSRHLPS